MTVSEPTTDPAPIRMRTSNDERRQVADIVSKSVEQGALTAEEGEQRLQAVGTTVFRDELAPIVADLPLGAALRVRGERTAAGHERLPVRAALRRLAGSVLVLGAALTAFLGRHRVVSVIAGLAAVVLVAGLVWAAADGFGGHRHFGDHGFGRHGHHGLADRFGEQR